MFCRTFTTKLLTTGALLFLAGQSTAQDASNFGPQPRVFGGVDLGAYLERASEANPDLEAFRQRYEAAEARIPQAGSLPDPMFQVTQFVESVETRNGPQDQVFMLNQRLPWFGKLDRKEAAASAEAEALWFAWQARELEVAQMVANAFYEYAYTRKAIALTEESLALLEELEPIVQERVRGGGDLNPLLRLKVEIGKFRDRQSSLEEKRHAQSARLAALLDLPAGVTLPWPEWGEPIPQPIPEGGLLVQALESNNPRLAMLERRVESAAVRRELARLEAFPDFTVGLNYIRLGEPSGAMTAPDPGKDPWGVMVAVNVPIWRERINAGRSEALASQRAAEAELRDTENQLKSELSVALSQLRDGQRRLDLYGEELLDLARQALENTRSSYEAGRAGILEVIDSERSLLELELLYWRAAADTYQARVALQTLINEPLYAGTPANF